jgi:hypothetical protein
VSIYLTDPVMLLRESLLPVLASWIHGDAVSVQSVSSSPHTVQVVGKSRTILLQGQRCSVLGLFLAAAMLREWLRDEASRAGRKDSSPTLGQAKELCRRARGWLLECFPSLRQVPENQWAQLSKPPFLPVLRWQSALVAAQEIVPISKAQRVERPELLDDTSYAVSLADCDLEGSASTFATFAAAIRDGKIPLQHLPELPDVPYVAVAVRVGGRHDARAGTGERRQRREDIARKAAVMYSECVRESTEGMPVDSPPDAAAWAGLELDPGRLCDARIAIKTRRELPLFLQSEDPLTQFDPRQHCAVVYGDLGHGRAELLDGAPSAIMNASLAEAYQLLGMRTEWHVCADFVVPGMKERRVVLHLDFLVKGENEPWGSLVWERFARLQGARMSGIGEAGVFPPLHLSRVVRRLGRMVDGMEEPRWVHPVVLCSPGMRGMGYVKRAGERWAAGMEGMMEGLEGMGRVKAFLWLPREVKAGARKGSLVEKATGGG